MKIQAEDTELTICYKDLQGNCLELSKQYGLINNNFKINLADYGNTENPVIVEFENIEHLENILKHFKKKYKQLNKENK